MGNPPKPKKCCRKMVLFSKALFLVTLLPKINFSIEFSSKTFKIFSKVPNNLRFSCVLFLRIFWKIRKNNSIVAIYLRIFLNIFEHFLKIYKRTCGFRPNAVKLAQSFSSYWKICINNVICPIFLRNLFWKFSKCSPP